VLITDLTPEVSEDYRRIMLRIISILFSGAPTSTTNGWKKSRMVPRDFCTSFHRTV